MAFWKKAFLSLLCLFIACFYLSIYFVADHSYRSGLENTRERAYGEAGFLAKSLEKDLAAITGRSGDTSEDIRSLFISYAEHYYRQSVYLSFMKDGHTVYSGMPGGGAPSFEVETGRQISKVAAIDGKNYMTVTVELEEPLRAYSFVYAHDMSELTRQYSDQTWFLVLLAFAVTILLAVGLFVVLRRLSKPIELLDQATGKIAVGNFSMRVPVRGKDEFASLAKHFNSMTDEMEARIRQLEQTAEQKQRFVDNLTHELKTPITAIRGYAEYIRNGRINEEDRLVSIERIIAETNRMHDMAFKLLDLAMMRHTGIKFTGIDLPRLLLEVEEHLRPALDQKKIALHIDCDGGSIQGDAILLKSLLMNLMDNAIKASGENARICMTAKQEGHSTVIHVRDFGKGMSKEHVERVMEPFYRIDPSRSRMEGGAGLGLALCREIALLHKAELSIASQINEGTTVTIVFAAS